ncbi:MAG TPA: ankyrin repeat domain-containing protein [Vicinamibacterales bacterium]
MVKRIVGVGLIAASAVVASTSTQHAQQPVKVDFARDVQPILRQQCYDCHGPEKQKNGLRLDRRRDAMRGGTIAVIGPGNAAGSRLYQRLIGHEFGTQMPPTRPLPESQISVIKRWIDEGAEWPDELSGEVPAAPVDPATADLIDAIRANDEARISGMLSNGGNPLKGRGPAGATPLMYAALYGDKALVQKLLDGGADPNAADDNAATALMWAIPDLEKTTLLLDRGASVAARSADGRTPLMIAAGLPGAEPIVRLLIERGAKVNERGPSLFGDASPLILAAYNGDAATFRLLVEKGADLESDGVPALAFALRAQCKSCVDLVLPKLPPQALTIAMTIGTPPRGPALATPLFLARGADPNARNMNGLTMLMSAAASEAQPVDIARMLIEAGADVNAKGPEGVTALQLARQRGRTPMVELLEKAGANDDGDAASAARFDPAPSARAALARTIPLLQRTDVEFLSKSGCVSCHNNTLTAMTVSAARSTGIKVNEEIAASQKKAIGEYVHSWRDRALQGIGIPGDADTVSYVLLGLAAENYPADTATDAMARFLKGQQRADGHWDLLGHRPPIEADELQVTAMSMRSLQLYAPAAQRAQYEPAIARAAEWIAAAEARSTQALAFKVLGLRWSHAKPDAIRPVVDRLLAQQRADGGWSQLPTLESDAYATGQVLYALAEGGVIEVNDPAYRRGVAFLLKTQMADGSWFVKSRAIPLQPYFDAGFPHGRDQFISAAATNWAALALARAR